MTIMERFWVGIGKVIGALIVWAFVLTAAGLAIAWPSPWTMVIALIILAVQSYRLVRAKRLVRALALQCVELEDRAEAGSGDAQLEMMLRMAAKVGQQDAMLRMFHERAG